MEGRGWGRGEVPPARASKNIFQSITHDVALTSAPMSAALVDFIRVALSEKVEEDGVLLWKGTCHAPWVPSTWLAGGVLGAKFGMGARAVKDIQSI